MENNVDPDQLASVKPADLVLQFSKHQGLHRLEKYLNIQDYLEKSLKIKFALKST